MMLRNDRRVTRRSFLGRVGSGAGTLAIARFCHGASGANGSRPNILFLMSDQHRWDFMGCSGHPFVQTPVLDRLAAEGTRFDGTFCQSPLCVPARMSIITGRYPHSHGALTNANTLPADQNTIGYHFKSMGYQTAAVGKMHFVGADQQHGFDYRVERTDYAEAVGEAGKRIREDVYGISPLTEEQTYEHFLADKMIAWLKENANRPFCAWCSMLAPHPPFVAPKTLYDMYAGKIKFPPQPPAPNPLIANVTRKWADLTEDQVYQIMTAYLGMITLVDRNIGRVLKALEQLGLAENTIVSYTSDHGDMEYEHKLFGKVVMYDGSTRVPFILRWPGHIPEKTVRHELVEHVDFYPTFCDLAGLPTPSTVQGKSMVPLITGTSTNWPNTVFSELQEMSMVRNQQHKCVFYNGRPRELYDMKADPREFHNMADQAASQAIIAQMTKERDDWMARTPSVPSNKAERENKAEKRKAKARQGKAKRKN